MTEEDNSAPHSDLIPMRAIGVVCSPRTNLSDDNWGDVVSVIELDPGQFNHQATAGLKDFSHLEVIFHFHRVPDDEIQTGSRHPRGRTDWPRVGIFAQRGKGRPNRIGVSRCKFVSVAGLRITVLGLDAVDGTPVLDVKPYMVEFGTRGEVIEPDWAKELMKDYYAGDTPIE